MFAEAPSYDVIVIGGGPAGLSGALVLARANRQVALIDAGRPRNRSARNLHNFLGKDGCSPQELLAAGRKDVARYGVEMISNEVVDIENLSTGDHTSFRVTVSSGREFIARKLLFATGLQDELPAWLGFGECYGVSVHHCPYCDAFEYRGRTIAACGNQPSEALGLAMALLTWSPNIVVLTDGSQVSEVQGMLPKLERLKLNYQESRIKQLVHRDGELLRVELEDGNKVECDSLFFNASQSPCCDLPRALGCKPVMTEDTPTNRKQQTNVRGIYLAGDADGDVKFVIIAAAEGAKAAVAINRELQEESFKNRGLPEQQ
jgi:thioredoxin reductase